MRFIMDYIIRTTKGAQYKLVFKPAPNRPAFASDATSTLSQKDSVRLLGESQPAKGTWQTLWRGIKPVIAHPLTQEKDIFEQINALINQKRLAIVPLNTLTSAPTGSDNLTQLPVEETAAPKEEAPQVLDDVVVKRKGQPPVSAQPCTEKNAAQSQSEPEKNDQPIAKCATEGDPVSMVTGEEMLQFNDAVLTGPMPFAWMRTYRSSHTRDIGVGVGWSHAGSEYLDLTREHLHYTDAEGRVIPFVLPHVGQRTKYLPEQLNIDHPNSDTFILQQTGQWDKVFTRVNASSERFLLTKIRHSAYKPATAHKEARGFCIDIDHNARGHIAQLKGNWGYSFVAQRDKQDRLTALFEKHDPSGQSRQVAAYTYNEHGDLTSHRDAQGIVADVGEHYTYKNHLITQRTLKTGFSFYFEWDGTDETARCTHNWGDRGIYEYYFDWDAANNQSKATDSRGYQRHYTYNSYGQICLKPSRMPQAKLPITVTMQTVSSILLLTRLAIKPNVIGMHRACLKSLLTPVAINAYFITILGGKSAPLITLA